MQILCQGKIWKCINMLSGDFLCGKSRIYLSGNFCQFSHLLSGFWGRKSASNLWKRRQERGTCARFFRGYIIAPEYNGKNWKRK